MNENTTELQTLSRVQIEGFRSLKNVDLSLGRVNVLIGANGSGKSNLLSAMKMLSLMRTQSLRRFVGEAGGASTLLHYGPNTTPLINLRVEFEQNGAIHAYGARLGNAARDSLLYLDETVEHRPSGRGDFQVHSLGSGHNESRLEEVTIPPVSEMARTVRSGLSGMAFFHFHDTSMSSPLRLNSRQSEDQVLRSDGRNLAAFLRRLAVSEGAEGQAAWNRIGLFLRQVAPYVKRLEPTLVDPTNPERSAVRLRWVDDREYTLDASDFSDGTLRALALITALAQPESQLPAFISIDEPGSGLHPSALSFMAGLIRSVSHRCQVLLATQSPVFLDEFAVSDVIVTERKEGATDFRRLDPAELTDWLEDYSLSQLYDKNVLGGRP